MQTSAATTNYNNSSDDIFTKPDISKLNQYYTDGDGADKEVFAEMRSNILLFSGEHYNRRQSTFYKRIRDSRELSQEQKIRLTKNHTQKICKTYSNNILSMSPGVGFSPKDENSNHDQKVSELHHAVWQDAIQKYSLDEAMDEWVDSFVQIGELAVKLFYDPTLGPVTGYEPLVEETTQEPIYDQMGNMQPDEKKPVNQGEFVFEEVYGFNLLRPLDCKDMTKSPWLCVRKMVERGDALRMFRGVPDIAKLIQPDVDETYVVFDASRGGYHKTRTQVMLREYYFRPCMAYPKGYFYITTRAGILAEGELPGGLFPIIWTAFDKLKTTPRGIGPIKTMRPYQAEINRSASKIAEHQITLGDDKLLIQNGTKVSAGVALPGIRSVNYTGAEPTILAGRSGEQYAAYAGSQITEMYQVMMVAEDSAEDQKQLDPMVLIYRSGTQKKKFQRYIARFERFLVRLVKLYLQLAKIHLPDEAVIFAVGKNEQVNIPEFRQLPDTCYEVKVEPQADDVETKLGKQLMLNHALQYVGPQLKPEDIGKIMRQMPYANFDQSFDDLTIDYDSTQNDILALDRGEQPPINQYDDHVYNIKRLTGRMRKADFKFLNPQIQQAYAMKTQLHEQMEAARVAAVQRAEQGFIPTGGYLVTCDFYVKDPTDATGVKTRRARVPYQAMEWLIKNMETQGQTQASLEGLPSGSQENIANRVASGGMNMNTGAAGPMGAPNGSGGNLPGAANGLAAMGSF